MAAEAQILPQHGGLSADSKTGTALLSISDTEEPVLEPPRARPKCGLSAVDEMAMEENGNKVATKLIIGLFKHCFLYITEPLSVKKPER